MTSRGIDAQVAELREDPGRLDLALGLRLLQVGEEQVVEVRLEEIAEGVVRGRTDGRVGLRSAVPPPEVVHRLARLVVVVDEQEAARGVRGHARQVGVGVGIPLGGQVTEQALLHLLPEVDPAEGLGLLHGRAQERSGLLASLGILRVQVLEELLRDLLDLQLAIAAQELVEHAGQLLLELGRQLERLVCLQELVETAGDWIGRRGLQRCRARFTARGAPEGASVTRRGAGWTRRQGGGGARLGAGDHVDALVDGDVGHAVFVEEIVPVLRVEAGLVDADELVEEHLQLFGADTPCEGDRAHVVVPQQLPELMCRTAPSHRAGRDAVDEQLLLRRRQRERTHVAEDDTQRADQLVHGRLDHARALGVELEILRRGVQAAVDVVHPGARLIREGGVRRGNPFAPRPGVGVGLARRVEHRRLGCRSLTVFDRAGQVACAPVIVRQLQKELRGHELVLLSAP